jgi:Tol biopolymer transport system component
MRPDGSNPSAFTVADNVNKYFNSYPSWCAAASKMAFSTNRDGNTEIYSMDANGSNQVNLTNNNYYDGQTDWSPDGKKIAFVSNRDGNSEIYTMDPDGNNVQRLTVSKPVDAWPRWSPDSKKIVFNTDRDGTNEIYVMDGDGSNQQRLTTNEFPDYGARWSPDGKKIVFNSERDGNPEIYIMDANGSNQKRLTFNSAKDYDPCLSPDGNRIAYYSNTDGNDEIYVMNLEGGNQVRLTKNKDADQTPLWISATLKSPDTKTLPLIPVKLCGGSDNIANFKYGSGEDQVHYVKVTPDKSGTISIIKVYSTKEGKVKAAIYENDAKTDLPAKKLNSNDSPTACAANQWNNVSISSTPVIAGTTYWLAFNSDTTGVVTIGTGKEKLVYKKAVFEDYTFPDTAETGFTISTWDVSTSGYGLIVEQGSK